MHNNADILTDPVSNNRKIPAKFLPFFKNFTELYLKNDSIFLISRIRASRLKHHRFAKMGASMDVDFSGEWRDRVPLGRVSDIDDLFTDITDPSWGYCRFDSLCRLLRGV